MPVGSVMPVGSSAGAAAPPLRIAAVVVAQLDAAAAVAEREHGLPREEPPQRRAHQLRAPAGREPARVPLQHLGEVGAGREHGGVEVELARPLRQPGAQHRDGRREAAIDAVRFRQPQLGRLEREPGLHRAEDGVGGAVLRRPVVDAADAGQLLARARRPLHDPRERELGQHVAGRHVEAFGGAFAPRRDFLRDAARPAPQLPRALDAPPRDFGFGTGAHLLAAVFALVERPFEPADRFEARDEHVLQFEQVRDVRGRVDAAAPP